ncbi:hypothetical protein P154DRAFT_532571 [Amniculicola lignicola CBS 123094]|uniref:Uncharacterized protein n=1 Tax=Amniculicola lignicola CBS 123094 TaxID=1392246 RepID=A0A6A5WMY9_9PLEO|nr:hypothetical protein P154DRAFT_532571 [Amniculicola lignicola CBS 123094]
MYPTTTSGAIRTPVIFEHIDAMPNTRIPPPQHAISSATGGFPIFVTKTATSLVTETVTSTVTRTVTQNLEPTLTRAMPPDTFTAAIHGLGDQAAASAPKSAIRSAILAAQSAFNGVNGTATPATVSSVSTAVAHNGNTSKFIQQVLPYAYGVGTVGLLAAGVYGYRRFNAPIPAAQTNQELEAVGAVNEDDIQQQLNSGFPPNEVEDTTHQHMNSSPLHNETSSTLATPPHGTRRIDHTVQAWKKEHDNMPIKVATPSHNATQKAYKGWPKVGVHELTSSHPRTPQTATPRQSTPKTALGREYRKTLDKLAEKGIYSGPEFRNALKKTREEFEASGLDFRNGTPTKNGHEALGWLRKGKRKAEEDIFPGDEDDVTPLTGHGQQQQQEDVDMSDGDSISTPEADLIDLQYGARHSLRHSPFHTPAPSTILDFDNIPRLRATSEQPRGRSPKRARTSSLPLDIENETSGSPTKAGKMSSKKARRYTTRSQMTESEKVRADNVIKNVQNFITDKAKEMVWSEESGWNSRGNVSPTRNSRNTSGVRKTLWTVKEEEEDI